MEAVSSEYYFPLYSALGYFALVFGIGEIARIITAKYVSPRGNSQLFLYELIGTIQMCTCVYENGIIFKNYGFPAIFICVALLLTAGNIFNRGAMTNCAPIFEQFVFGNLGSSKFLTILSAQLIGATFASKFAYLIWNITAPYSTAHLENASNLECILHYKQTAGIVIGFEIVGAFVVRIVVAQLLARPALIKLIPFAISAYLSLALYVVGVPGLNPIVATARLYGCRGIDNSSFFILYWFCPVLGWLTGAYVVGQKSPSKKSAKDVKAEKKAKAAAKKSD
ncbi:Putative aquaporin-10 [Caenorhabditis elegans]|uniref:Putative aquaporin-10 n=1 Tax=Caenorhabditis elegans TaxID=6239 RepID=AQP10_CAEEL|nr:Putative aquaporin-10 [Caenorhabditis elegans]Q09369.1 RecName: Full=Putative aquaporin-10 [Caenorhabditis elegans]CAA88476.1 Putative aquaporin-10 [Caenorhabditis elegans]|eukprot:NP_496105.1 Putative aquaporin-10 [Caenorhabditis elegans]